MRTISSTDGVTLAVHESGPADGRPLLLCHATGFHGRVWNRLAAHLPDRRCIALDFRGYGASTEGTLPPHWRGFGDDVLAVIDDLGLEGVQGVGHSKGGAALFLAEIARPGTMSGLVCFEPIAFPPDPSSQGPNPLAELTRRRRQTFPSRDDAFDNYRTKATLGALDPAVLQDYVDHGFVDTRDGDVTLAGRAEWEAATYDMARVNSAWDHLDEVACPVLVVHGGDGDGPAMIAPLIAARLPAGELLAEPRLGHFGPLEDPAWFASVVTARLG